MTPPRERIVTPEEALRRLEGGWAVATANERENLLHTVATEPKRRDEYARVAVVKALSDVAATLDPECARVVMGRADAFRRGERDL